MEQNTQQKKTQKNPYSLWDYPQLIDYLECMAAEGWMLESYSQKTLDFIAVQPQKIRFAVTFFKDYNYMGHTPPDNLQFMWEMCETDGWKNITHNDYIQIFYNQNPDAPPFHTDAAVQLENFHSMVESSLVKKWRYSAYFMVLFLLFRLVSVINQLTSADITPPERYTAIIFTVIVMGYLLYELLYNLFRWVSYKEWYWKAAATAQQENVFMPPFEYSFYDKLNFIVTVVFCAAFTLALFLLGVPKNILGISGEMIAINFVSIFVFSRIFVSIRIVQGEDDGFIVPVKDRYPTSTALLCLGVAIVLWVLWLVGQ